MFNRKTMYILLLASFIEISLSMFFTRERFKLDVMAMAAIYLCWLVIYVFGLFQVFDLDGDGGILGHLGSGKGDNLARRANLVILCLFGLILMPGGILWAVLSSS